MHDELEVELTDGQIKMLDFKFCIDFLTIYFEWTELCQKYPVYLIGFKLDVWGDRIVLIREKFIYGG